MLLKIPYAIIKTTGNDKKLTIYKSPANQYLVKYF
nr:MAG TPA: hypothetical protein [Caudoviricetes sp.]